ncbi:hypothetical protein Tco_0069137, partial [Tanacetum coccineum]
METMWHLFDPTPSGWTSKLRNDILMCQQRQVQIFYDRINPDLRRTVDYVTRGRLRKMSPEKAWTTIEELAQYEEEGWNDLIFPKRRSLNHETANVEQVMQLEEYMSVIGNDFMQLSLKVVEKLKDKIRIKESKK